MLTRRALLAAVAALSLPLPLPRLAHAKPLAPPPIPPLPVAFHVAAVEGAPVREAAWVEAQLAVARALYEPLGIPLRQASARPLVASLARLESRADRDALAAHLVPKQINVFVVAALRDVDDPRLYRMGVCWRNRKQPGKQYLVVAESAREATLAHEIGHLMGLDHSSVPDNVMSYERSGAPVFFDEAQAERMRRAARAHLAGKRLEPWAPSAS